jgi:hypothetical protein
VIRKQARLKNHMDQNNKSLKGTDDKAAENNQYDDYNWYPDQQIF